MTNSADDIVAIETTTRSLYASICFGPGGRPSLEQLRELFVPAGRLIDNNGNEPVFKSVDEFIAAYQDQLDGGKIASFYEGERSSHTELFGKIAHRFSTYEAKLNVADEKPFCMGINSIQFIKIGGVWRVTCMVWNDETNGLRIPREYL